MVGAIKNSLSQDIPLWSIILGKSGIVGLGRGTDDVEKGSYKKRQTQERIHIIC